MNESVMTAATGPVLRLTPGAVPLADWRAIYRGATP